MHLFCFGLGYTALHLAKHLQSQGWRVGGTCRSHEKQQKLRAEDIEAIVFGETLPEGITHILHSIPPEEAGDPVLQIYRSLRAEGVAIQGNLKEQRNMPLDCHVANAPRSDEEVQWLGYLSTTGVYGDHQGGWVDETTPVNPPNLRSKRRVDAENAWASTGLPVHIFRLSGIYGPGKSALDSVRDGTAKRIDKPNQYFSRIHVEDIVQTLCASIAKPHPGAIYNVADDLPCAQAEVITYACDLLGAPPPPLVPFEQAQLSEMARSFYANSRRMRNDKIKDELGVRLHYPDYRAGLLGMV